MNPPAFHIESSAIDGVQGEDSSLFLEIGQGFFSTAVMLASSRRFVALDFYEIKNLSRPDELQALMLSHPLLNRHYRHVVIAFNTKESVLLPEEAWDANQQEKIVMAIHGDLNPGTVLSDAVSEWQIRNIYRVPHFYHDDMTKLFPGKRYLHTYSAILKMLRTRQDTLPENYMYLVFYPRHITVTVVRGHQLQLMQSYSYDIPEDVSYHLLNIADQFQLSPAQTLLKISGLVDMDSVLFSELLKYFLIVETDPRPAYFSYDAAFDAYPLHFFTPLFFLGLCV